MHAVLTASERPSYRLALLDADPDLGADLSPDEFRQARAELAVAGLVLRPGEWNPVSLAALEHNAFAAIVVNGLLTHDVSVSENPCLELFGPGDVVGSWPLNGGMLPVDDVWHVAATTTLAILDDRFLAAVRRWPRLLTALVQRVAGQGNRSVVQLAIAQQPRVESRLLTLFWHLAERFGRMTPDGVMVPLTLTHDALGRLVGARRPTVTLALKALAESGAVERGDDRSWLVHKQPDDAPPPVRPLSDGARPRLVEVSAPPSDG
jgi:CRP-like cAMP-binding protein